MTTLDPQAKALIDMVYRVGAPRFHDLDVAKARHSFQKLQFALRPEAPAVASVTDVPIPRAHAREGVIMGRLYRPLNSAAGDALPLVFYFHGGGWCVGDLASYDVLCRELANQSGAAVLSVDYAGAGRGTRTPTPFRAADFESAASTDSAIPAGWEAGLSVGGHHRCKRKSRTRRSLPSAPAR